MFAYQEPLEYGFWGKATSTIDWCEENYVVSYYVAEAVNTITNAAFIALAVYALRNCFRNRLEHRFTLACCGFMLVGVGSWLFHMTLKYHFQLLDELPMIYATCVPLWSTFTWARSKRTEQLLGGGIFLGAALLTAVYLRYKDPTIHQAAYGALNVVIILKSVQQSHWYVKSKNPKAMSDLNWTLFFGVFEFLFGWFLWNLDIHFCNTWISLRRKVGMPLGFLLEGHGHWHLLTGLGVYSYLQYLEYLRVFQLGINGDYRYEWKFKFFPVVRYVPKHE